MKKRENSEFDIPYKGLGFGTHKINYKIGKAFFKSIEYSDINQGNIEVTINLIKESTMMILDFNIQGYVELMCDRCLENYQQEIEGNFKLIVKFGAESEEISDEIIIISDDYNNFNLAQYIYEYIVLLLPLKHVHPDDKFGNHTCDVEMLKQIEEYSGTKTDPRWAALKEIKLDK